MSHHVVPAPPNSGSNWHSLFQVFGRFGQILMHRSCCYTKDIAGQAVHFNQGTFKSICKPQPLQHRRAICYPGSSDGGFFSPDLMPPGSDEQGETPQKKGLAGEEGWWHNMASHGACLFTSKSVIRLKVVNTVPCQILFFESAWQSRNPMILWKTAVKTP